MKPRGAIIQGALALVGLGAAYATWQREPEKAPGDVVIVDATKNDVERVRFEDDRGWVELSRRRDGSEAGVWLKLSAKPDAKQPEREVRGSEAAERLYDSFAPLRATRGLGVFEPPKLKEFGLAPEDAKDGGAPPPYRKRTITVNAKGDARVFTAGTPPGGYATYLRDERDGRVYVVGGSLVSDLESASTRMVERTLHAFKAGDFDGVVVEAGGKKRELVVLSPEQGFQAKFASKKSPEKADETAKNWHGRVFGVYPTDVLGRGEAPAAGTPEPALKVTWTSKGQQKGWIEVGKVQPAAAQPPPGTSPVPAPPPPVEYYAKSERTAGWVKLGGGAEEIVKEAEKIAGAE